MVIGTGQNGTWIFADRARRSEPARARTIFVTTDRPGISARIRIVGCDAALDSMFFLY